MSFLNGRTYRLATSVLKHSILSLCCLTLLSCNSSDAKKLDEAQFPDRAVATSEATYAGPNELSHVQLLSKTNWVVTDFKSVWKTEDSGKTWNRTLGPLGGEGSGDFTGGLSFVDSQIGFVVINQQLLRTVDGGSSWTHVTDLQFAPRNIFFADMMNGWGAGSDWTDNPVESRKLLYVGKLWHTLDGGKTWHEQVLPKIYMDTHSDRWDIKDIYFSDARNGWAVGNGVFLHSEDAGKSWKELNIRGDFSRIIFANEELGWAIHRGSGMFELTDDGGRSWKHIEMDVQTTEVRVLFVTRKHGFAIEGAVWFLGSTDGGENWQSVTEPNDTLRAIENDKLLGPSFVGRAKDGNLVAVWLTGNPKGTICLISTDEGKSWKDRP